MNYIDNIFIICIQVWRIWCNYFTFKWVSSWKHVYCFINVFKINDLLDILFVSLAIYWLIKLIAETRAAQLVKGLVVLLVVTQLSAWFNLNVINFILTNVMQVGFLALIIVFQPELRRALEQAGMIIPVGVKMLYTLRKNSLLSVKKVTRKMDVFEELLQLQ